MSGWADLVELAKLLNPIRPLLHYTLGYGQMLHGPVFMHVDYAGPFIRKMFLVVVDVHSKWPEALVMNSTTSQSTMEALRTLFGRYGLPEQLVSETGHNLHPVISLTSRVQTVLSTFGLPRTTCFKWSGRNVCADIEEILESQ